MGWGWHGWYWGGPGIFWFAFIVVIVLLLMRRDRHVRPPQRETPEEILRRRYASGEISSEDYQRMLSELRR